jgi:hypothetical protein
MSQVKAVVKSIFEDPLGSCLTASCYIVVSSIGIWALMFSIKLGLTIILGHTT